MLMIATLKGSLDDKGKHMSEHFNDVAARAQSDFNDMFAKIVATDVGNARSEVPVDEPRITSGIQAELWPLLQELQEAKGRLEDADPLRPRLQRLIQKVEQIGRPAPTVRSERSASSVTRPDLLQKKYSEAVLAKLADLVVRNQALGPDDAAVYVVNFATVPNGIDPGAVPYTIVSKIGEEEAANSIILVYTLSAFEEAKVPSASTIKQYVDMPLASKVKKVVLLEPNEAFVTWAARNPSVLDRPGRHVVVSDLAQLVEIVGAVPKGLPPTAVESLTKPDSIVTAPVNGKNKSVRLHQNSVQLVGPTAKVAGHELAGVTVILIESIREARALRDSTRAFSLRLMDGTLYEILAPESSSLFQGVMGLMNRNRTLNALGDHVKIDTSTLQWLMLNLAFINMVNAGVDPIVRKSALDLVYAVFATFNFAREIQIRKAPIEILPENLLSFVTAVSEDVAEHNPDSAEGFISEFFKAYRYVDDACKPAAFYFLRPWIRHWAASIDHLGQFIEVFVGAWKEMPLQKSSFSSSVWAELARERKAVFAVNRYIATNAAPNLVSLAVNIAVFNKPDSSTFWLDELLTDSRQRVTFASTVIAALFVATAFDNEGFLIDLLHRIAVLRIQFPEDVLQSCLPMLENVLRSLSWESSQSIPIDYAVVCYSFTSVAELAEFRAGRPRPWLDLTTILVSAIRAVTSGGDADSALYERFQPDTEEGDPALRATGLLFTGAYAGEEEAEDFTRSALALVGNDLSNGPAVAYALALIPMEEAFAPRLFFVGALLALLTGGAALPLIASAVRQLGRSNPTDDVPSEVIQALTNITGLDWEGSPIYAGLVFLAAFAEAEDGPSVAEFLAGGTKEKLASVYGLITGGDVTKALKINFEARSVEVGICVLGLLRAFPSPQLVEYAIGLCRKRPSPLAGIKVLGSPFGQELLSSVAQPALAHQLAVTAEREGSKAALPPVLAELLKEDGKRLRIPLEQAAPLFEALLPESSS
jgi:hypothetical protein